MAAIVAALVCIQLSRFFLTAPLELALCFDHEHRAAASQPAAQASHGDHHHHHEMASPPQQDNGNAVKHCKDTYQGSSLIPAESMDVPAGAFALGPLALSEFRVSESEPALQILSHSVFHPPQLLS